MLTDEAYHVYQSWEHRLRGWDIFDCPVQIEPIPQGVRFKEPVPVDDGRFKLFQKRPKQTPLELVEPKAYESSQDELLVAFGISVSEDSLNNAEFSGLVQSLAQAEYPVTFELGKESSEQAAQLMLMKMTSL